MVSFLYNNHNRNPWGCLLEIIMWLPKCLWSKPEEYCHLSITWMIYLNDNLTTKKKQLCAYLTHWGWVLDMCISKLTIIGSDNGLSSGQHQAIIWTNAGILFILTLGTTSREIVNEIHNIYSRKCIWKCCLFSFNNFFRLTTKETLKLYIINPLWGYKGPLMWELFSISWCHRDII